MAFHVNTVLEQEGVEIIFRGPGKRAQAFHVNTVLGSEMRRLLKEKIAATQKNYDAEDGWIPAEEVLPVLKDPAGRAAACLRGLRHRENITQRTLAAKIGILPHHLSEMEHGKRPIGKAMAKKLAAALKADWRVFL